jgi:hypothetical protein
VKKRRKVEVVSMLKRMLQVMLIGLTTLVGAAGAHTQISAPVVLDVARGDQEITLFGARGGNPNARGPEQGDHLGRVTKGDFNGDGLQDIAVGVPNARNGRGEVYIIFGRRDAASFPACRDTRFRRCFDAAQTVGPLPDVVITGSSPWFFLGETIGSGNINGDSFDDIIVGAVASDGRGTVFAIFGRTNFPPQTTIGGESQKLTINGINTNDWMTVVARQNRDVNGDGIGDLIAAAPLARDNAGEVYIFFGSRQLLPTTTNAANANVTIQGRDREDFLGAAGSTPGGFANSLTTGDIDADGIADVIIGAPGGDGPDNRRQNAGDVYVFFGRAQWPQLIDLASQDADVTIYGAEAGDTLGAEFGVYTANLNGDTVAGRPVLDILLTAPHGHGPDENADGQPNDRRDFAGEAYVVLGRERAAWPKVIDLCQNVAAPSMNCAPTQQRVPNSGHFDMIIFGADVADLLGKVIAGGDSDGDGHEDLIVSARWSEAINNSRRNTGEAVVVLGSKQFQIAGTPQEALAIDTCVPSNFPNVPLEAVNCERRRVPNSGVHDVIIYAAEEGVGQRDPVVGDGAYFVEIADIIADGNGEAIVASNWADGPANGRVDAGELYAFLGRPWRTSP